ncbi:hypothetical protein GURASL_19010 [Geotalea uraniireducens]|uniref:Uncharacterized protein n=1 Tax=Geotalea uraniireducens TaxID=351604 RepID=A0ABM8EKB1_9BACT|nr:kelch repeat-containing protein [Geotalea uraniireducens]BDV42978.1 hypothetical protein GURASL_19010 [Geotalea uraniireducens]
MKRMKLLLLILMFLIMAGGAGRATAAIFVLTSDQHGNSLSDVWSISKATYKGSACEIKFIWEVPGNNTYPQFQYYSSWPIWPPNGAAGCMNVPTAACGGRYTFDQVTGGSWMMDVGYADFQDKTFTASWLSGYSRACSDVPIQDGESDIFARYQRNAQVVTRYFYDGGSTAYAGPVRRLPVGSMQYYLPENKEADNKFIVDLKHHDYANSWAQSLDQIKSNGGPYGNVREELSPATDGTPDEYLDYYYTTGAKFTVSNNIPGPLALTSARQGHSSLPLPDGRLLVLGGGTVNNAMLDLSTDSWADASTPFTVIYHTATLLANGKVLLAGGSANGTDSNAARLYDPAANSWSDAAPMAVPRRAAGAVRLANGKVLVAGGIQGSSTVLQSAELYDPATDSWSPAADLPEPRYAAATLLLPTGKVLMAGGSTVPGTPLKSAVLYDPATDSWSTTAAMTTARYAPAIALLSDNSVLVAGGSGDSVALASVELFDYAGRTATITTDGWRTAGATLGTARYHAAGLTLPDGKVLISGGLMQGGNTLATVELLELDANGVIQNRNGNNVQLVPAMTPALGSALFTGTKWLPATTGSLTAGSIAALRENARWLPLGWAGGTGRVAAAGSTATAALGANATSTIKWLYEKHFITRVVADDTGMPTEIKARFEEQYDILGSGGASIKTATTVTNPSVVTDTAYLTAASTSAITVPRTITRTYNSVVENWVLESPALPIWATMTYDGVNDRYRIDQGRQFLPWTYRFVYTKRLNVTVAVNGVDDADKALFRNLPGISPAPATTAVTYRADETAALVAPNTVYAQGNTVRYVLSGWTGTGSISDGNAAAGMATTATPTIGTNSTITWNYRKQLRVAVTTVGEDTPLTVVDLPGDTTAGSATVTAIATAGLNPGMVASGYGIPAGTAIVAIDAVNGTMTLSAAATQSYAGTAGQRLTLSTVPATDSADPRECPSPDNDIATCAANAAATVSNVHYYDASTISQQTSLTLTALQSFTDPLSSSPRTLTQVIYSGGGSGNVQTISNGRKTLSTYSLDKPMTVEWRYDQTKAYIIGKPVFAPEGQNIDTSRKPEITILSAALAGDTADSAFVWGWDNSVPANQGMRYFPIHPVNSFTIKWPLINSTATYDETCMTIWPQKQKHIAEAPANLQPPDAVNTFNAISYTTNGADATLATFNASSAGTSVLRFTTPVALPDLKPGTAFIVVETEALEPAKLEEIPWEIGRKITDPGHRDPENETVPSRNKTGYLFYDGGVYDGAGSDRAYDRSNRTGAIIPVNRSLPGDVKPLVVVWYERGQGDIGWPVTPKRYKADWPATPQTITIGNGIAVSPTAKPQARVYNQPDKTLAGYNPNEEHALITGDTLYALRDDLNAIKDESKPYVLLKYFDTTAQEWTMEAYRVVRPAAGFTYTVDAGSPITPPFPSSFQVPPQSGIKSGAGEEWHLQDHNGGHWAKAANWKTGDSKTDADKSRFVMQWYYSMRADFYWPFTGTLARVAGDPIPFLNNSSRGYYATGDLPVDVSYVTKWPDETPTLAMGDTLTTARDGLPDLYNFKSAEMIFDENVYSGKGPLAKLYAPERYLYTGLAALPATIPTEIGSGGVKTFPTLPYAIQARLFYDPAGKRLGYKGVWIANDGETPWLLPNLMTATEQAAIRALSTDSAWTAAVDALYGLGRNPNAVDDGSWNAARINPYRPSDTTGGWKSAWGIRLGLALRNGSLAAARSIVGEKNALTAGMAQGTGYVVLVENNDDALLDAPVQLHVLRIVNEPVYRGVIKALKAQNVFDEKLTLHYTGDFGGEPEKFNFEWYYQPVAGSMPSLPSAGPADDSWTKFIVADSDGYGLSDITIAGASPLTMSDNWFVARYYYKAAWPELAEASDPLNAVTPHDDRNNWSGWSGANSTDSPMLALGWVKRVVDGLNPLEARVTDFRNSATNTTVSMISQYGTRYEGDVAMNSDADNLNGMGLIPAYETVLNRARQFSIDAVPPQNYGPTNDALLNISSRLATFYLALGNEAYADAVDPTIGFSTKSAEYGSMAPSVFTFQNQLDSLLEEELALLRGRDDSAGSTHNAPYYNRLIWNFTQGEGEVAYAQNYNITDQDGNGIINAADAKIMYPQGHGDAWGHYLQAIGYYYKLLGHPSFSWEPRVEYVLVAGQPIMVDYLDERKFAAIAAARAKTGAEILDLTYRKFYTDDPAGQWQGYTDTYLNRAWGVDEWARRAGQAAYFDWVTANAILPDSIPAAAHDRKKYVTDSTGALHEETIAGADIQQIDRSKVPELTSIASQFHKIQAKMNEVNDGINPLGLVKGVVPFDIDPALIDAGQTHFEQVYARAEKALENAVAAYDYANGYTQRLRQNQDTLEDFKKNLDDQERDYKNRLIEIFGYPYPDDIGAGKTYPDGYDGPDIFHYNYVDRTELTGGTPLPDITYTTYDVSYTLPADFWALGLTNYTIDAGTSHTVKYTIDTAHLWLEKDPSWSSERRAPGRVQQALSDLIQAQAAYDKAFKEYESQLGGIEDAKTNLEQRYNILANQILVRDQNEGAQIGLDSTINALHAAGLVFKRGSTILRDVGDSMCEALPTEASIWGGDVTAPARSAIKLLAYIGAGALDIGGDATDMGEFSLSTVKERMQAGMELKLAKSDASWEVSQLVKELQNSMADLDLKLLELYSLSETIRQTAGNYQAALAEGLRLWDERTEKRAQAAAEVQEYRYQDLGFRVFRNDAIQKFRAQFDLAAKYVYLAATAYDYETNLLGTASGAGRKFLSEVARQRTLGVVSNGIPQAGFPGLADVMARLSQNFGIYRTQLGFNNPQTETTPFSLRTGLFRVKADSTADNDWRNVLKDHLVTDLWQIPEFRRYCRPFAPESAGAQPGIVIRFPTTVTYGKNFFGWPLSGGDSAYSTSNFSTRVRSVGVWFENYNSQVLSSTPRIYLVPTGADVLRSPTGDGFATRDWLVRDQKLPVPFTLGSTDLTNPEFIPVNDSLSDELYDIRKLADFRAYPYSGAFNPSQTTADNRLIGRSVWNTQWMLIIPGSTLLFNKDVGLNTFINMVNDIKMFFQTYAYSGN